MALGAIKATPASALPTTNTALVCVGDPGKTPQAAFGLVCVGDPGYSKAVIN